MFIGDQSGQVTILKLEQENCTLVTTFRGHTGGIESGPYKCCSHPDLSPAACSDVHMMCCWGTLWTCVMVTHDRCNWLQRDSVRWRVRNTLHQFKQKSKQSVSEVVVIWFFIMLCWRKPWWANIKWDVVWGCVATAWTLEGQLPRSVLALPGARRWCLGQTCTSKTSEMKNRFLTGS